MRCFALAGPLAAAAALLAGCSSTDPAAACDDFGNSRMPVCAGSFCSIENVFTPAANWRPLLIVPVATAGADGTALVARMIPSPESIRKSIVSIGSFAPRVG